SIGHQDPGATSVMFMMQMLALAAKEQGIGDGKPGHSFT
ncbi:dihydroxyacetone kinase, partial [Escherichia coli]